MNKNFLDKSEEVVPLNGDLPLFDVSIIGAGVAGLYASYCCGISGISSCIIDSLMCAGGQCSVLYPDKKIYGVPGFIDATAKEFISKLSKQAFDFSKHFFFGQKVQNISKMPNGCFKTQSNDLNIFSKNVIMASGIGDMKPSVPSNICGLSEIEKGSDFVQYYCMRTDLYKGKNVVIAGGGDSAVDFASNISTIAKKVTLIHRRNKLTCDEHKIRELTRLTESGKLELRLEKQIKSVGENELGRYVEINDEILDVDYIVFCYGFLTSSGCIAGLDELGLKFDGNLIDVNIDTMETNVENCYAIGDVANYTNKKKNIVPCFFEADRAVRVIKSRRSV